MIINTSELGKTKSMAINLFKGNKIYSLNSANGELVIICELSNARFDMPFAIDNKGLDLIKKFENPNLELDGRRLIVKEGKKKFTIDTFTYELPQFDLTSMQKCDVDLDILKTARKFTSKKDTRPVLTSVNLVENGNIYASDSFSLYRYEKVDSIDDFQLKSINIPNTFIDVLDKNNNDNSNIELMFNSKCVLVVNNNIKYISRLVVGNFPNVNRLINEQKSQHLEMDLNELKENISFANNVGASKDNNASIVCRLRNNTLKCYGACEFETEFESAKFNENYEFSIVIELVQLLLSSVDQKLEKIRLEFEGMRKAITYRDDLGQTILITPILKQYDE